MDIADVSSYPNQQSDCKESHEESYMPTCSNCYHMMREIMSLRMELNRYRNKDVRPKKIFTIASTLYTFCGNGLSKRHLAR